jgi:hypothetical protein
MRVIGSTYLVIVTCAIVHGYGCEPTFYLYNIIGLGNRYIAKKLIIVFVHRRGSGAITTKCLFK